ncbi:MAG: CoA pyrophosphatase [Clostridioides sp.]|nr:CoA pyrophosphatase [Clostridioides sp.]
MRDLRTKFDGYKPYINGSSQMKRASVLVPIVEKSGEEYILFEVRSKNLKHQPNEISFPGGKIEADEQPIDAVLRETYEELGTNQSNIELVSELDLIITPFNYIVHPFLGYIHEDIDLSMSNDEVDHCFLVPLKYLLQNPPHEFINTLEVNPDKDIPSNYLPCDDYKFLGGKSTVLFYQYDGYVIWGMTAKILQNFLNVLSE